MGKLRSLSISVFVPFCNCHIAGQNEKEGRKAKRKPVEVPFWDISLIYLGNYLICLKVITNLDSIFKSRDITLPTKVRLVKAMVFPAVMYGCESWTVKKAER